MAMPLNRPSFHISGNDVHNVFQLVGDDEDSISLAIAWGLTNSPHLLRFFVDAVVGRTVPLDGVAIRVHRHEQGGGITDIEIESAGVLHLVVEAKRGWILPAERQLLLYAGRQTFAESRAKHKRLVTLSEATEVFAATQFRVSKIAGVPLVHVSWRSLARWCEVARRAAGPRERQLVAELREYLESLMSSQKQDSNIVYVVSLGAGKPHGATTTWIDIVARHGRYFHPLAKGWPKEPPNYLAFRYAGKLQSIHHVDGYEVVTSLGTACKGMSRRKVVPHLLYRLGTAIRPGQVVKNGRIWPNGRYWCALDTLLTSKTVAEARDETKRRGLETSET